MPKVTSLSALESQTSRTSKQVPLSPEELTEYLTSLKLASRCESYVIRLVRYELDSGTLIPVNCLNRSYTDKELAELDYGTLVANVRANKDFFLQTELEVKSGWSDSASTIVQTHNNFHD